MGFACPQSAFDMDEAKTLSTQYQYDLTDRIKSGEYIYPEELAHCLRNAENGKIPNEILRYIVGTLEGAHKRPPGRRPLMLIEKYKQNLHPVIFAFCYFNWLKHRSGGTANFARAIKASDIWDSSPYTMSLMMVAHKFKNDASKWESMRNTVEAHPLTKVLRKEARLGENSEYHTR